MYVEVKGQMDRSMGVRCWLGDDGQLRTVYGEIWPAVGWSSRGVRQSDDFVAYEEMP